MMMCKMGRLAIFTYCTLLFPIFSTYTLPPTGIISPSDDSDANIFDHWVPRCLDHKIHLPKNKMVRVLKFHTKGLRRLEIDAMIRQCFQTLCKDWMSECHWYCDAVKNDNHLRRCKDCLSWRGQQCIDCFDI
ncbi:hypothetical protein DICVIV_13629 [Dictyocaulus viviparus]|uniref:Uncharacterized protein n=1 Tax=Dictyocaulus viviparus TaxID=29172 RepID=A0A0D8X7B3_DICVI|nr:hypothetical protein DICVIV_13629 [Dictyocaulus viviparus]